MVVVPHLTRALGSGDFPLAPRERLIMPARLDRSLVICAATFVALAASEAKAGFSASVDSGPEFAFHSGLLAGASASITLGGEWDNNHRIAGRGTLILIDPF